METINLNLTKQIGPRISAGSSEAEAIIHVLYARAIQCQVEKRTLRERYPAGDSSR